MSKKLEHVACPEHIHYRISDVYELEIFNLRGKELGLFENFLGEKVPYGKYEMPPNPQNPSNISLIVFDKITLKKIIKWLKENHSHEYARRRRH